MRGDIADRHGKIWKKCLEQIKENLEPLHKGANDRFSVLSRVATKIFEGIGEALIK